MTKLFLIGSPVSKSKSPTMQNAWLKEKNFDVVYEAIKVSPDGLRAFMPTVRDYLGGNVTAPLKELIIPFCDTLDDHAEMVGAVNTIVVDDGEIIGYNTDVHGFMRGLGKMPVRNAVVLGNGGAARAAVVGLTTIGASIYVSGRSEEKTRSLVQAMGSTCFPVRWEEVTQGLSDCDLLVNATGVKNLPIDISGLPARAVVYDLAYGDDMELLTRAKEQGLKTLDGNEMLIHQGALSFSLWFRNYPA